jgi:hypothetical protein
VSCLSVHFGLPPIGWGEEEDEPDAQSGGPFLACGSRGDCHSNSDSALSTYSGLFSQFSFLIYFLFHSNRIVLPVLRSWLATSFLSSFTGNSE